VFQGLASSAHAHQLNSAYASVLRGPSGAAAWRPWKGLIVKPAADKVKCVAATDNPEDGFCHLIIHL